MKALITGGAGFIGASLAERLVSDGHDVLVLDNLSTGKPEFIEAIKDNPNFSFREIDTLKDDITEYFSGVDTVFHFSANRDVRTGADNTKIDLEQNIIATHNVLEAMRKKSVGKIIFASTSAVYGNAETPTKETHHLSPISLYGASKASCEALITAYSHTFGIDYCILRMANIIGPKSDHGVVPDFISKLKKNPKRLEILGDGNQTKSYLYIDDCVDGIMGCSQRRNKIFNLGSEDRVTVKEIARAVSDAMSLSPEFTFTGGPQGWKGDVPVMLLDISRAKGVGWKPKLSSGEAVRKTVDGIVSGI